MSSTYGQRLRVTLFGQSHSAGIGVVIEGLPVGFRPDMDALRAFLARRAPGGSALVSARREADEFEVLSGLAGGYTCGAPFCAIIQNADARPGDYAPLRDTPRPGHADFTAQIKYKGYQDAAGGGHFSGRLTAPLCLAGGLAMQLLIREGVSIGAHITRVGAATERRFDPLAPELSLLPNAPMRVLDPDAGRKMEAEIESARLAGDSVGGEIELAAIGVAPGLGDPMFDGLENRIARAVFGIPAIKGVEFGEGFGVCSLRGSENNDAFYWDNGTIQTRTNRCGGILGGISTGMPILLRTAVKPTPSIAMEQETVRMSSGEPARITATGRHDPAIVVRAVPCVEAATALAIYDALLCAEGGYRP